MTWGMHRSQAMEEVGSIRAGKERASLARCVGRGVGGVGVGMGHASLASYEIGRASCRERVYDLV